MQSPFPGMNPWLEADEWSDLHNSLSVIIKEQIVPLVAPKYLVRVEKYVIEDTNPSEDIGIFYPDVSLLKNKHTDRTKEPIAPYYTNALTPPTLTISRILNIEVNIPVIEIRDRKDNQLVTAIEVLSPVNKRKPGLEIYRKKRKQLHKDGVHLLEIDLLRRGERPFNYPSLPKDAHYFVMLIRADKSNTEIWAMRIEDELPVVPVPLKNPDSDIKFDLGLAFTEVFKRSRYDLSLDYSGPAPTPIFSSEELAWIKTRTHPNNLKQMRKYPTDSAS